MAKRSARDLNQALRYAGSQAALARQLGVSPSTVRRWKAQGVPQDRVEQLQALVAIRKAAPKPPRAVARPGSTLKAALKRAGSAASLARELGVSTSTVQRWDRAGKPSAAGLEKLVRAQERAQAYRAAVKTERERLKELLGFAGQLDKIPEFKTGEGVRSGERTQGYRYTRRWHRELTEMFIEQLRQWVLGLKVRYRYWQGIVSLMHFDPEGENEFKRSGPNVFISMGDAGEGADVLIDATLTTHRLRSRQQLADEIAGMLEEAIEGGFYGFIVGTTVFNYRLRTEEERKIWVRSKKFREKMAKKEQRKRKAPKRNLLPSPPKQRVRLLPPPRK